MRTPPQVEEPIVLTENQKRLQKRIQIMPKEPKQVLTDLVMNEKMDPETVLGMADEYRAAENQRIEDHNEMLKRSRQMLGKRGKVIHMERYEEPQQIKGFDEVADMMARRYPNLLGDNPEQALFDLLKQGNLKAPSMADAIRHAADQIREGAGGQPAPDTSFEFGAMADLAQKFAADEAGALDIDTAKKYAGVIFDHLKTAANHLNNSWKELAGEMAPRTSQLSRTTGEALSRYNATRAYAKEAAPYYIDKIMGPDATPEQRRLFGTAFQEMRHRYAREALAAEAERRTVEADQAAEEALALRAEMRAAKGRRLDRAARMWNEAKERATVASRAATKAQRDAESIKSLIGQDGSPIADEAGFEAVVGSPEFQGFLERWKAEFVPVMEQHFRQAQGLESDDPIDSLTQIPGLPMNAKAIRGDGPVPEGAVFIGQGRGNLKNLKIGKLKFAERATLAADGYDTDIGSIIENSLALGAQAARKAEMYRTAVAEGVGKWANPGQRIEGFREIPGTRPPKGTQEAAGNQVFYADHRVYDEMLRGLAVERPFDSPTSRNIAKAITLAALTSTAEATYHTKNLLTFLTKPGVSPKDVIGNAIRLWTNDPTAKRELMQLASIGALKEHGPETGNLWADPQTQALLKDVFGGAPPPKLDPTYWVGRALDFVDRTMRLTANQAFDRMEKAGLAQATEQNRRDFINQLGQYNSRAQHKWVAFFRNSGLGPFATAGTNYYVQGLRALTGETGLRATSFEAGVRLRAEQIARTLSIPIATFLLNYLMWGRVDGDDQTPIGAVKLGYDADKGRTSYYDLTAFTGLTRGARQVGLVALTEGAREGKSSSEIIDKGYEDAIHSALHPAIGPPVAFAYTAATGRNTMGRKVAEKGEPEAIQNLKAALSQANPAYSALSGADYPTKEVPWDERAAKLLGPFGPKYRYEKGRARPERLSR